MSSKGIPFQVDTRPTKQVVVSSLTKDASVEEAVFDLIDNSIDAARDTMLSSAADEDRHILPASYRGFEVSLVFSGTRLRVSDNCGGITRDDLASIALRFGETSAHELGIGVFGVGLNRALFKLGARSVLSTDTGTEKSELILDVPRYLKAKDDWSVPAQELPSSGKAGTEIDISALPPPISRLFADQDWLAEIQAEIARRYGQFITKGLNIRVDGATIAPHIMEIRQNSPVVGEYKVFKAGDGVSVHIEFGQHNDHRFTNQDGYDKTRNAELSQEFGWTVICNDRVILMADRSYKTGWDKGFHTEFYGFAGIASFVAKNPAHLPWNTMKTDVDLNNPAYQAALSDMRRFANKWRSAMELRKKTSAKGEKIRDLPPVTPKPAPAPSSPPARPVPLPPGRSTKPDPIKKPDHHEYRTLLPRDINEVHCFDKHLALVHEAQRADVYEDPYSSLALLRMLFETSGVEYFRRHKRADELRDYAVTARLAKGNTLTEAQKKQAYPTMDELLAFLLGDASVWGATKSPLKHSLNKMKGYQKQLNGVLHHPFQQVPQHLAVTIRDEVTPILRHLIEA